MSVDTKALGAALATVTQPLPWTVSPVQGDGRTITLDADGMWVADFGEAPADAEYATAAANAVPLLLARIEELEAENAELRALLRDACDIAARFATNTKVTDKWRGEAWDRISAILREGGV